MEWRIIFTATVLLLNHNAMSFRQGWHKQWMQDRNDYHFSRQEDFFSEADFFKDTYMSNSRPDSDEINSPEFAPHNTYSRITGDRDPHLSSHEDDFSGDDILKEIHYSNSRPDSDEMNSPELLPFHTTMKSMRRKITTPTTTEPTTESTTEPTTESRTESTTEPITESRTESTTKPTTEFTTETTTDTTRDLLICIRFCPVTSEFNPVCGTNLVTYTNPGRLICAKRCGLVVDILGPAPCPPNITEILSTSQSPTTSTTAKVISNTTSETMFQQECIKSCDRSSEMRPICGSNDITYKNTQQLMCAQHCGIDVRLKKFSPCTDVNSEPTSSTTARNIETVLDLRSNSSLPPYQQYCIKGCPVTSDHNPVCGTNDVTYKNPSVLKCLIICGINVQLKHNSSCVNNNANNNYKPVNSTSAPVQVTMPLPTQVNLCIKACPTLTEDKPICGTNGVTYKNPSHLQCEKICGVNVTLKTYDACPVPNLLQEITTNRNPEDVLTTSTTSAPEITKEPIGVMTDQNIINTTFNNQTTTDSSVFEIDRRIGGID